MSFKRISALFLCLITLFCSVSCHNVNGGFTSETYASTSEGEYDFGGFTSIQYPQVLASEMSFTLSAEDIKSFEDQLLVCRRVYFSGDKKRADEFKKELYKLGALKAVIETQEDIAYMLYCCDMRDSTARENYVYAVNKNSGTDQKLLSFYSDAKNGKNILIQIMHDFIKEMYPQGLVTRTQEASALNKKMNTINSDFEALADKSAETVFPLFIEYVKLSKEYAENSGYKNYYELASKTKYRRDYDKTEREAFRDYVKKYIVPLCREMKALSSKVLSRTSAGDRALANAYMDDEWKSFGGNLLGRYFESLADSSRDAMLHAFNNDRIVIGDKPGSRTRAFVTTVGDQPMCYLYKGDMNFITTSHELGHYYANLAGMSSKTSYDLRETHSQANTLLLISFLYGKLDKEAYSYFAVHQLYSMVYTIVVHTLRDEFDEIVLSSDDIDGYTAESLEAIMEGLIEEYGFSDILTQTAKTSILTYWYRLGISDMCYNMSYAVGVVPAMQIYMLSLEDFSAAAEAYASICEDIDKSRTFVGTVDRAGLTSVFSESTYKKLELLSDIAEKMFIG